MRAVRLLVSGRVQGVGFRYFVAAQARGLGLPGYVRNLRDGRVQAEFSGSDDQVEALLAACRVGPSGARVDACEAEACDAGMLPHPFEVRRDG